MKRKFKWFIALVALMAALSLTACGDNEEAAVDDTQDSTWADRYETLLEAGDARDNADYDSLKAELDDIRAASGATYVYVLTPGTDGTPDINAESGEEGHYLITVDGSEEPDDWAVDYGWEIQFTEAWEGTPAAARSAWNDSDTEQCWSAFAPVYDSNGTVVCILGIDYPCTEVIAEYPEWNRDSDSWNGFEDEIDADIPTEVQEMMDLTIELATKYADQLSNAKS